MQKETLSFTQQKLFPLVWEEGLRPGPPLSLPRGSPGRRRVLDGDAAQPCCPLESAGSRASSRKALPAPSTAACREEGRGQGCRAPQGAGLAGRSSGGSGAPALVLFLRREPSPAPLSRVRAPQGGQTQQRAQWGHSAAPDQGVRGSSFTPDAFLSPRPPPRRAVGRGRRHGYEPLLGPTAAGPPAHRATPFP